MAQIKNTPDYILRHYADEIEQQCRICGEQREFSIYWAQDNLFYVCKECYRIIRGLYIDILLETEEDENISTNEQLNKLNDKINTIKNMRLQNGSK